MQEHERSRYRRKIQPAAWVGQGEGTGAGKEAVGQGEDKGRTRRRAGA